MTKSRNDPRTKLVIVLMVVLLIPVAARADSGTPLMWAGLLHLFIGNAFIGLLEGFLLVKLFKASSSKCLLIMVGANYFSSWVGGFFIQFVSFQIPLNLYNGWSWFWILVVLTYLLTLVLEWPFVFLCFWRTPGALGKSLRGDVAVNTISYIILFGWYWLASDAGLYRHMHIVQPSQMPMPNAVVYYIASTNGQVNALDLQTQTTLKFLKLDQPLGSLRLVIRPAVFNPANWDVVEEYAYTNILMASNLALVASEDWRNPNLSRWYQVHQIGMATGSKWTFETGSGSGEGLTGRNAETGERFDLSMDAPFLSWTIQNGSHLPGDNVIFQLGEDQICLLETSTRKIALLCRGWSPVVFLKKQ
jgi:energy-coupling factor transporter transmembrane protein EcfT